MIILFYFTLLFTSTSLLLNDCQKTPFWKLNLCQIDCSKCGTNAVCEECPDGFTLTQSKCQPNSDLIYHNTYFTAPQFNSTVINQKMFKASNQYITENNVVRICQGDTYKFDMLGLFKQQTRVTFNVNFDTPVTEVKIKFNFLTIYNNTKLEVVLNGEQVHQAVYKNSGVDNSYEGSQSSINYLKVPSLKESSVNAIIKKVETDPIPFSEFQFNQNNQLRLQVTYTTNTTNTSPFWAFSDFSLTGKKCQQCIPQKLKTLSTNVAIAIAITSAALLILILIMYASVKLSQKKRLNSNQSTTTYHNLNQNIQKQDEKEEEKDNDLKIRDTINKTQQTNKNNKKNKNS